jgi:hypothetical protein
MKPGDQVKTKYGIGIIHRKSFDQKFQRYKYAVEILHDERLAKVVKKRIEIMHFYDYEIKEVEK